MTEGKEIQIDEGEFTRIHNAILEALARVRLSGAEYRCLMFLFRKTYGWQKKEDRISLSQWAEGTDSKRPHVLATLNELVKKKIITRRADPDGGQIPFYSFNKYTEQWEDVAVDSERGNRFHKQEVLPEQVQLPKQVTVTRAGNTTVTNTGNGTVTKAGTHKRKKETIKDKESPAHQIMFGTLARICVVDPKLKAGQIARTVKSLRSASYTQQDLENFETWWKSKDFRGQRGEPPTLAQVLDKIAQAKQEITPTRTHVPTTQLIELPGGQIVEAHT